MSQIEIHVRSIDGTYIFDMDLQIDATYDLNTLKAILRQKQRVLVSSDYSLLVFNGKNLLEEDESSLLFHLGVKNNDLIVLCPKGQFLISVHMQCGYVQVLEVDCLMKVKQLKRMINESTSYDLVMFAKFRDTLVIKELDDDENCLAVYDIVARPLITLPIHDVVVRHPQDLRGINRFFDMNQAPIKISVELFAEGCKSLLVTLRVNPSDGINSLKFHIQNWLCMYEGLYFPSYLYLQCSLFLKEGEKLVYSLFYDKEKMFKDDPPSSTFQECNISNETSLFIIPSKTLRLSVLCSVAPDDLPALLFPFKVRSCLDSIRYLKDRLFTMTGIPPDKQILFCDGQLMIDDERSLLDYGIIEQTDNVSEILCSRLLIHVIPYKEVSLMTLEIQIHVENPNTDSTFPLSFSPTDTIDCLKTKIRVISDEDDMLVFCGINLLEEDGSNALLDYHIEDKARLQLCKKGSFSILVCERDSGDSHDIEVESLDTVDNLKKKIQEKTKIAPENQSLFRKVDGYRMEINTGCLVQHGIVKPLPGMLKHVIFYSGDHEESWNSSKGSDEYRLPRIPWSFWRSLSDDASAGIPLREFFRRPCCHPYLEGSLKVYVEIRFSEWLTFRMTLRQGPGDTVKSMKAMIQERVKLEDIIVNLTYIKEGEFVLLFNKQQLLEDESTLAQCGIDDESLILVCPKASFSIRVLVIIYNEVFGTTTFPDFEIFVNGLDTVESVKAKIMSGFNVEVESLWCDEAPLSSESLLVECGIVVHQKPTAQLNCKRHELKLTGHCICSSPSSLQAHILF